MKINILDILKTEFKQLALDIIQQGNSQVRGIIEDNIHVNEQELPIKGEYSIKVKTLTKTEKDDILK
jgi:hypothetical protein